MHFYCEILAARNWDWGRLTRSPGGRKCKTHGVDNLAGVQQQQLVPWFDAFVDMVEREFENYTSPLPTEINYCYWQTVKLRTLRVSRSSVWWSRWERERVRVTCHLYRQKSTTAALRPSNWGHWESQSPQFDGPGERVRGFENYTSPLPTEINYSNWQTVKQRTFSPAHRSDGSIVFHY